jgi:hypothetical protein
VSTHLSRKELKQDKFAVEVEHTVDFFAAHRKEIQKYGIAAAVLIVIVGGGLYARNMVSSARQKALGDAISVAAAPITQMPNPNGAISFQSEAAKRDAAAKAFSKVAADYKGDDEGYIAEYFLASQDADAEKLDDARRKYQDVADHAPANYASLAKFALAQIDFAQNRGAEAETLLKDLMDHPTDMVSKNQATVTLAKGIAASKPEEARKLLSPLASAKSDISSIASAALDELPKK